MSEEITGFPLCWPLNKPRHATERRNSPFKAGYDRTIREVKYEVDRLGGSELIISSNLPLRRDGFPLTVKSPPKDPGVAVYFKRRGKPICFACDRWPTVAENLHSVYLTMDALRGIARWGSSEMMEAAFTGFTALPAPEQPWQVLGLSSSRPTREQIDTAHRQLAMKHHPDRQGGSVDAMVRVNAARDDLYRELGLS